MNQTTFKSNNKGPLPLGLQIFKQTQTLGQIQNEGILTFGHHLEVILDSFKHFL